MSIHKRIMTVKAFIASEYGYFLLVWHFHSTKLNEQVNNIHDRGLTTIKVGEVSEKTEKGIIIRPAKSSPEIFQ